jgi:hypothetical protein
LRSEGKPIIKDSDRLRDKEKSIMGNAKWLPGNMDRLSGKTESESRRTDSKLWKIELSLSKEKPVLGNANQLQGNVDRLSRKTDPETEPSSGKEELGPSHRCGLREELEPISGEEENEELVIGKSMSENVGSPIDEEVMELMKEYDSVERGDMI